MLVVNQDGVFQIQTDGTVSQLVAGPVAYAVDDTQGGLLFQVEGGRDWEDFFGDPTPGRSTVVWWVPRGDSVPRELLAPTPAAGHALTLHDAFATDESFAVVYLRHEGEEPPFNGNMADTLRVYDAATRTVTQLYSVRGYEWNLVDVSAGDGLVSAMEVQTGGHGCRLFDGSGNVVTRPGVPTATPTCFEESGNCPASCALSVDAARVAYDWLKRGQDDAVDWEIAVAEVDTGAEEARFVVPVIGRWDPAELDIHDDLVLLNRAWEGLYEEPALLADMSDPTSAPTALPIAGRARFVTQAINITAPVTAPGP